jgi:hypothetical protein
MNNPGIFGWIRESVRRSVLLGFSDAVEQLGTSAESSEALHPQLAAVLREAAPRALAVEAELAPVSAKPQQRKRLGRSLEQLRTSGPLKPSDQDE